MTNKKVYKIRKKDTGDFVSLGYNQKSSWNVYPSAAIKENIQDKSKYEVVIFEYELKETKVIDLR